MPDEKREPSKYASMKPVVVVGTLAWADVPVFFLSEWTQLFAGWEASDWNAELYLQTNGASLLPHVRNQAVCQAIERRPHFTHLVLVDSDMTGLYIEQVRRLVEHDVPIVGPLCTWKFDPYNPAMWDHDGCEAIYRELEKEDPGLVPRHWIGTGCICIRRDVIEDMGIECLGARLATGDRLQRGFIWFRTGRDLTVDWERRRNAAIMDGARRTAGHVAEKLENGEVIQPGDFVRTHADMFEAALSAFNEAPTTGEDLEFGLRALGKGHVSWVDCGIRLGHLGQRAYGMPDHLKAKNIELKREIEDIQTNARLIKG